MHSPVKGQVFLFDERALALPSDAYERKAEGLGFSRVAGIDEAGRGPLAGPVIAASMILPYHFSLPGLNDSKALSPKNRERLFIEILRSAVAWGIGICGPEEIDTLNILRASLEAMARAVARMKIRPDFLLIDGIHPVPVELPQRTIKRGDRLSVSIAAASILAKVTRDRIMEREHIRYPEYDFARNKGYGTRHHRQALERIGYCPIHRRTFRGVKGLPEAGSRANRIGNWKFIA